jgi:hypothetical protein
MLKRGPGGRQKSVVWGWATIGEAGDQTVGGGGGSGTWATVGGQLVGYCGPAVLGLARNKESFSIFGFLFKKKLT